MGGSSPGNLPSMSPFDQGLSDLNNYGQLQQEPVNYADYLYPQTSWNSEERMQVGLNLEQQSELMLDLQNSGTGQINQMIQASNALFYPRGVHNY